MRLTWSRRKSLSASVGAAGNRRPASPTVFSTLELFSYLDANRDSLPDYGARYRAQPADLDRLHRIGRHEVVAKRMNKNQPMR